jgi:hypothetical protein
MIFSTCQTGPGRGCTKKIRVIRHAKGKNGGHVLPLRKLRDLSKDPLRVPFFFRNLLVHPWSYTDFHHP